MTRKVRWKNQVNEFVKLTDSRIGNWKQKFENTQESLTVIEKDGIADRKIANETCASSTTIKQSTDHRKHLKLR